MANTRNQGLQALRGVAAMMVFVHHLPWLTNNVTGQKLMIIQHMQFGAFGVYLFFALSGYLMVHKVSLRSPVRFLEARFRRIYPSLWCAIVFSAILLWITGAKFTLPWQALTLWPVGAPSDTTVPYWTLLYEMAFYLWVFACLLIAGKRAIFVLVAFLIASYLLSARPYNWGEIVFADWHDLLFSVFSVYFLAGIFVGWLPKINNRAVGVMLAVFGALLYGLPEIAIYTGMPSLNYPAVFKDSGSFPHVLRAIGCGLIVWSAIRWEASRGLGAVLARLGDYSYGIYLVHIAGLFLAAYIARKLQMQSLPYFVVMPFLAVIALPIAVAFGWFDWKLQSWLRASGSALRKAPGNWNSDSVKPYGNTNGS